MYAIIWVVCNKILISVLSDLLLQNFLSENSIFIFFRTLPKNARNYKLLYVENVVFNLVFLNVSWRHH